MTKQVKYRNPPIVEVAMGVGFRRLDKLAAPHFGLFWESKKEQFPQFQQVPPNLAAEQGLDVASIPIRCWFLSQDNRSLLQLQHNSFFFNWRTGSPGGQNDYPKFHKLYPAFKEQLFDVQSFFEKSEIGRLEVQNFELTYVNLIEESSLKGVVRNSASLLVDHLQEERKRFLPDPSNFQWTTIYPMPREAGNLVVRAGSATQKDDAEKQILRLELSASGASSGQLDMDQWFETAHHQIVNGFADITDQKVQNEVWERLP